MQDKCAEWENGKLVLERLSENHECPSERHTLEAGTLAFRLDVHGLRDVSLYCCAEHIFDFLRYFGSGTPARDLRAISAGERKQVVYTADRQETNDYPCLACEEEISDGDDCYTFAPPLIDAFPAGIHADCTSVFMDALDDVRDAAAEHPGELLPALL